MTRPTVKDNLGIVWAVAFDIREKWDLTELIEDSDILSEGYLALVEAIKNYNPKKVKSSLSSYLAIAVRTRMEDWLRKDRFFYLPNRTRNHCYAIDQFYRQHNKFPNKEELSRYLNFQRLTDRRYQQIRQAYHLYTAKVYSS